MKPNFLDIKGIIFIIVYITILSLAFLVYSNVKYSKDINTKNLFLKSYFYKILMGIGFAFIYDFYYNWLGDTYSYFLNASRLGDVLFTHPGAFFKLLLGLVDSSNVSDLPQSINYYPYLKDTSVFAIHRFLTLFTIIGQKNYYLTIICLNTFLFLLNWKFFRFLTSQFPDKNKIIAIAVLFIPSVTFWGSGLLKDPFTYSFSFVFIIYFYRLFFLRKIKLKNIIYIIISSYVVLSLKPYILYVLIMCCFIWLGFSYLYLIKNKFIRVIIFPLLMLIVAFAGIYVLDSIASRVGGAYENIDSMLSKASAAQYDLKQDYYDGSSFDIGNYEPTIKGVISITPAAIIAGLYRPFIWEAKSIVMILSGIENFVLLFISIFVILKVGLKFFFQSIVRNPFLIFCIAYSIIMAWGIGISTSNFGALVRFKIPLLPFFLMFWLFIWNEYKAYKKMVI